MGFAIERITSAEDSEVTFRDRIIDQSGDAIQQADVASIAYRVADVTAPSTVVASGSLTVASVVYDTLQTTDWTADAIGYNFKGTLAGTCFPSGEKVYRVEFTFTMGSGGPLYVLKEVSTAERFGG